MNLQLGNRIQIAKILRFWTVLIVSTGLFIVFTALVYSSGPHFLRGQNYDSLMRAAFALALALPIFIGFSFITQQRKFALPAYILVFSAYLAQWALAAYILVPKSFTQTNPIESTRYFLILLAICLANFLAPFCVSRIKPLSVYKYFVAFIYHFVEVAVYCLVVYLGFFLIYGTCSALFGFRMTYQFTSSVFFFIVFLYGASLFAAKLPDYVSVQEAYSSDTKSFFSKELTFLVEWILVPIVVIYFAVFVAYISKIIFTGDWPTNTTSYFIGMYALVSLATWYLSTPLVNAPARNKLIMFFHSAVFYTFLPSAFLLLSSIHLRTSDVGFTETRYFVYVIGVFMLLVFVLNIFLKKSRFFALPFLAVVLLLVSNFGPYSAYEVSARSQVNELIELLEADGVLTDPVSSTKVADSKIATNPRLMSIANYLSARNKLNYLAPVLKLSQKQFEANIAQMKSAAKVYFDSQALMAYLGYDFSNYTDGNFLPGTEYFYFKADPALMDVADYAYVLPINTCSGCPEVGELTNSVLAASLSSTSLVIDYKDRISEVSFESIFSPLEIKSLSVNSAAPKKVDIPDVGAFYIIRLHGKVDLEVGALVQIDSLEGYLLVR